MTVIEATVALPWPRSTRSIIRGLEDEKVDGG
jgi:hypothetical protein